jgi:hypothetical protein
MILSPKPLGDTHRREGGGRTASDPWAQRPAKGRAPSTMVNNDFAPAFAEWARSQPRLRLMGPESRVLSELGSSSKWRAAILDERQPMQRNGVPRYEAIRSRYYTYVEWERTERQLYYLREDLHQLNNVYRTSAPSLIADLKARLE